MEAGDVVQFSSKGVNDWTHSAIISRVTAFSGEIYVCMHDAYSWTSNVKLSTFYAGEYPSNQTRHIMLIKVTGYYS
ncbi:hypothetical protein LJC42_08200 [Eubacteriales bacterium OttesenSCG-928-K08]|nr:hypothetical protein [Eubacteriales bacterium OttesenSCG-928-K08]